MMIVNSTGFRYAHGPDSIFNVDDIEYKWYKYNSLYCDTNIY